MRAQRRSFGYRRAMTRAAEPELVFDLAAQVDVLIMAAHALELGPLRAALGADFRAVFGGRVIGMSEVGVGALLAGAGAMHALCTRRPRAALLVGSCGVYPGRAVFSPGQLVIPSRIAALDAAVLAGHAAFPAPMPAAIELDRAMRAQLAHAARRGEPAPAPLEGPLATTLAITTDDALAARLGSGGDCLAENLEALPVALACHSQHVPFAALLGVTNAVGSQGREQWREHHAVAAQTTAGCITRWLATTD
jgi:futalosine hydrolase